MADRFVPGLELSRRLYRDGVAPLLAARFPTLRYAAALIGSGSEVLGYDTARSTDHDWGPRLQLFLDDQDSHRLASDITSLLSDHLPKEILGYPTNFVTAANGVTRHLRTTDGPVDHGVEVTDLPAWIAANLGLDARARMSNLDWLSIPTQVLAGVTAGAVFRDDPGQLTRARERLAWYPTDIWRYILACQWQRIAEEEAFVGRCGEVGDELGSAVVAGRLVHDVMRLQLLQHRRYPPYSKWLGSAFAGLPDASRVAPQLARAMSASTSGEREQALSSVYEIAAEAQNKLGLADFVDPTTRPFHDRPFRVLHAERFAEALRESIGDPELRKLPLVGAVDQWIGNTTALGRYGQLRRVQIEMTAGE